MASRFVRYGKGIGIIACLLMLMASRADAGWDCLTDFCRWTGYGFGDGYHRCPCPPSSVSPARCGCDPLGLNGPCRHCRATPANAPLPEPCAARPHSAHPPTRPRYVLLPPEYSPQPAIFQATRPKHDDTLQPKRLVPIDEVPAWNRDLPRTDAGNP
jgi:hypothetical protein